MSDDSIADTDWQELTACVGLQQTGPIDMKTIFAAAIALAMGTGAAHAQAGGAGPYAPITPFVIWSNQSAAGKPLTPMPELMRKGREGESLNSAPTPRGFALRPPAPGAAVRN